MMKANNADSMGTLVEMLTKNANLELDEPVFRKIKSLCRSSSENISHAFYLLMSQMQKEHAEIRYIILLAVNELFIRSVEFRDLLLKNMEEFLELTMETNPDNELPPPKAVARRLKDQTYSFLKSWRTKFGDMYTRLNLACTYLEAHQNVQLDRENNQPSTSTQNNQFLGHHEGTAKKKVEGILKEMQIVEEEISYTISQIKSCYDTISLTPDALFKPSDFIANFDPVCESHSSSKENELLRQHGITDLKSNISVKVNTISPIVVEENEDNTSTLKILKELLRKVSTDYMPQITRWTKVLVKDDKYAPQLRKAINLRNTLQNEVKKYEQLKFRSKGPVSEEFLKVTDSVKEKEDSDDEFEDVQEKEGFEPFAFSSSSGCSSNVDGGNNTVSENVAEINAEDSVEVRTLMAKKTVDVSCIKKKVMENNLQEASSSNDWQDPELLKDIEAATGINLKIPEKRKRNSKASPKSNKKKHSKTPVRTDIKASQNTTYSRLYKKIFKK